MGGLILDDIQDPAEGLALLAKKPAHEMMPEQKRNRLFWRFMFTQWQNWLTGDTLAIGRAIACCGLLHRAPPRWLRNAVVELVDQRMSPAERRLQSALHVHMMRWEAVRVARENSNTWDDSWEVAAEMLAGGDAAGASDTMRASYALIQDAGGSDATLASYQEAVARRDR
jgi:hypothetical protein